MKDIRELLEGGKTAEQIQALVNAEIKMYQEEQAKDTKIETARIEMNDAIVEYFTVLGLITNNEDRKLLENELAKMTKEIETMSKSLRELSDLTNKPNTSPNKSNKKRPTDDELLKEFLKSII